MLFVISEENGLAAARYQVDPTGEWFKEESTKVRVSVSISDRTPAKLRCTTGQRPGETTATH